MYPILTGDGIWDCSTGEHIWGGGWLLVDMFAHNKSGIAYRDGNPRSETVVDHICTRWAKGGPWALPFGGD
jgi:hypothetical protein